jgi:hypothetical protein
MSYVKIRPFAIKRHCDLTGLPNLAGGLVSFFRSWHHYGAKEAIDHFAAAHDEWPALEAEP